LDCSNSFYQWNRIEKRPVLILWNDGNDIVLATVTSAKPRTQTDVVLKNWANSGLRVESTVRLSRLDCIEKSLMISKLGKLSVEDANKLKEIWTNYVKPQF
jgi:mRNA interferase MazF